jgi:hypothetical protein
MSQALDQALETARALRKAGDAAASEQAYAEAATLARAEDEASRLAHALRHVSDLARDRGAFELALSAAREAVGFYRAAPAGHSLDLANALRLQALALGALVQECEAAAAWREARDLYASQRVGAGVEECNRHLDG